MSKRWTITLFIDEPDDARTFLENLQSIPDFRYCVGQAEIAPETGRLHLQGYLEVNAKISMASLKSQLDEPTAHLERARGSGAENDAYCTKDGRVAGPWTFGEHLVQGSRTDLAEIAGRIAAGASMAEIAREHPGDYIRYHKGLLAYQQQVVGNVPRTWKSTVHVIIGPTGVGKTRSVYDGNPPESIFSLDDPTGRWWDGYQGQENVLIDEFMGQIDYTYLLKLLDRYPMRVQTKGGWTNFCPRHIFITSNFEPEQWYREPRDIAPLLRRLDEITHLTA